MSTEPIALQVQELPEIHHFEISWSPTIGKIADALAKAQLEFKPVIKSTDNAAFMRGGRASKYADLAEYIDATQAALAKNGLVVTQWPDVSPEAKSMSLVSILMHSSGEWMKGKITLPAIGRDGFSPQTCGSSITYARRYSYAAIVGVASEDDDGNAASGRGTSAAAAEVAQEKVKKFEREQNIKAETVPDTLFYTLPPTHNGHKAEFINVYKFIAAHPENEEGIKMAFSKHGAKQTAGKTALVPADQLDDLLASLNGDLGLKVHKLQASS